jgi:hypothetical protein
VRRYILELHLCGNVFTAHCVDNIKAALDPQLNGSSGAAGASVSIVFDRSGADVQGDDEVKGATAVCIAAQQGHLAVVERLIASGADGSIARSTDGATAAYSVPEHLLCSVCHDAPCGRIEQCENGHLLCAEAEIGVGEACSVQVRSVGGRCPVCLRGMASMPIRAISAEQSIAALPAMCRHCDAASTRGEVLAHVAQCPRSPAQCAAAAAEGCRGEGLTGTREAHGVVDSEGCEYELVMPVTTGCAAERRALSHWQWRQWGTPASPSRDKPSVAPETAAAAVTAVGGRPGVHQSVGRNVEVQGWHAALMQDHGSTGPWAFGVALRTALLQSLQEGDSILAAEQASLSMALPQWLAGPYTRPLLRTT